MNFTDTDLKANRDGHLSQLQRRNMRLSALKYLIGALFFAIVVCYLLFGVVTTIFDSPLAAMILLGLAVICVMITLLLGWTAYSLNMAVNAGKVEEIEGELSLLRHESQSMRGRSRTYYALVDDVRLRISRKQYRQLSDCDAGIYRVYYTPQIERVVSLEPVGKIKP